MNAIYQLKADELDENFVNGIKEAFKDKEIEIAVYERDVSRDNVLRLLNIGDGAQEMFAVRR